MIEVSTDGRFWLRVDLTPSAFKKLPKTQWLEVPNTADKSLGHGPTNVAVSAISFYREASND